MHLWLSLLMTTLTNLNVPMGFSWMAFQGLWFKQKRYEKYEGAVAKTSAIRVRDGYRKFTTKHWETFQLFNCYNLLVKEL